MFRFKDKSLTALAALTLTVATANAESGVPEWFSSGGGLKNQSHQDAETVIAPATAPGLSVLWQAELDGSISATAAVEGDAVYVPDWGGSLHRLDAATGAAVWSRSVSEYSGIAGDFARVTPAIGEDVIIIGNQAARNNVARDPSKGGATVMAIDKATGDLVWKTVVDPHPRAIVTASPVISAGIVYVGVASFEEDAAPGCCDFRGSAVALDVATGQVLWQSFMAPEGYSGNAIWSSAPVVDSKLGQLYVTTGNNYLIPADVLACVTAATGDFDPDDFTLEDRDNAIESVKACYGANFEANAFNSVVALDLETGERNWTTHTLPFDAWTAACFAPIALPTCLDGPDYDFGQGPMLFSKRKTSVLAVGQKSGDFWGLNPETGEIVWKSKVAPGSAFAGGLQWGSATDGSRIYTGANVAVNDSFIPKPWTLQGGGNNGETVATGFWSAIDGLTGEILWQVQDLNLSGDIGRMAVANGVVFAGSLGTPAPFGGAANDPTMVALDAETGAILWSFVSGGSVISGAAVVDGVVYWGSGYDYFGLGTNNNKFFAFAP